MKRFFLVFLLALSGSATGYASQKSVVCHMNGIDDAVSFVLPNEMGGLPKIDFPYPVNVTRFSMRSGNLLLVAMDQDETDRPRIFVSAQLNKNNQTYIGQFMTDLGGNQLQLDNGSVSCVTK